MLFFWNVKVGNKAEENKYSIYIFFINSDDFGLSPKYCLKQMVFASTSSKTSSRILLKGLSPSSEHTSPSEYIQVLASFSHSSLSLSLFLSSLSPSLYLSISQSRWHQQYQLYVQPICSAQEKGSVCL